MGYVEGRNIYDQRKQLTELAHPVGPRGRDYVEAGGLVSHGPSIAGVRERLAVVLDKILKGAKPADLPVEELTKFELAINLTTAKALGLTIPQSVLRQATEVIQ